VRHLLTNTPFLTAKDKYSIVFHGQSDGQNHYNTAALLRSARVADNKNQEIIAFAKKQRCGLAQENNSNLFAYYQSRKKLDTT